MPVSPALAENLAQPVVEMYAEAERTLLARIAKSLAKGLDAPHWAEKKLLEVQFMQAQVKHLVADLGNRAAAQVAVQLAEAYNRGGASAAMDLAALLKVGLEDVSAPLLSLPTVELLVSETMGYLNATGPRILRSTMDTYRAAIAAGSQQAFLGVMGKVEAAEAARDITAGGIGQVLTGAQTRRQAAQAVLDKFAQKGIVGFIDKRGQGWNLTSYVEMAMRTGCSRAAVQGHTDRLLENGLDLVIVSNAPRECPTCRPWEGKVLSISALPVEMPEDMDPAFKVAAEEPTPATPQGFLTDAFDEQDRYVAYHGTSAGYKATAAENAKLRKLIEEQGLQPSTMMSGATLTTSRETAGNYARDGFVLEYRIPKAKLEEYVMKGGEFPGKPGTYHHGLKKSLPGRYLRKPKK